MNKSITSLLLLFAFQLANGQTTLFRDSGPGNPVKVSANATKAHFLPGVILVKFKDAASVVPGEAGGLKKTGVPTVDAIFKQYEVTSVVQVFKGAKPLEQSQTLKAFNGYTFERPSLHNIYELTIKDPLKQFDAIQTLKGDPNVVYAEPDYVYSIVNDKPESGIITPQEIHEYLNDHGTSGSNPKSPRVVTPLDPLYSQQWAIPAVHADAVWDTTTGDSSQIIAFLDTGVDWHHPDLADNIWTNTAEANGITGVDDDNDGYVDDLHGWDFINNDGDPSDDNSHGTHVAGIACAVGNNGIGIAGVDWHARIMPIKVFQSNGQGDAATITQGIYYAVLKGATVINMSFGSYAESLTMEAALQYAYAQCVLVAAAGNDAADINSIRPGPFFPAALSYVLGVQATSQGGGLASFSNFDPDGPVYSQYQNLWNYELRAPGDGIISTIPEGNYRVYSGTSMATPVVSGAVALYRQLHPGQSQELMLGNLINTSADNMNIFAALNVHPNPELWFVSNTIVDTLAGDNGNGLVDAGETIQEWFTVRNTWGQSDSVFVGLQLGEFEDTSVAHILNSVAYLGSISPYATRTNEANPFVIQISPSVAEGRTIVFRATLWYRGAVDTTKQQIVLTASNGQLLAGVMDSTLTLTPNRIWLVNQSFRVGSNGTLTINPGTRIVLNNLLVNKGHIYALGTADSNIVFNGPSGFSGVGSFTFSYTQFISTNDGFGDDMFGSSVYTFDHCKFDGFYETKSNSMFLGTNFSFSECVFVNCMFGIFNIYHAPVLYKCTIDNCNTIAASYASGQSWFPGNYNNFNRLFNYAPALWPTSVLFPTTDAASVGNNFLGFGQNSFAVYAVGTGDIVKIPNQYWGTVDSSRIEGKIFDFWENANLPMVNFKPYLTAPSDSAHGIVWKVLVDGIDPQDQKNLMSPIGAGPHRFDVYFNRSMDTTHTPQLSFGVRDPFNQQAVTDSAHWSDTARVWTAYKTVKLYTGDGINMIRVSSATDPEGFEIPVEDMRFSFLIDAAGTESVDFAATPGLGKVQLDWVKPDLPDILGYNMYRFNNLTDTTYSDTTLISTKLVTDTTYTDFNVVPGKNYYYAYKVVRTDFTESEYSKFVGTKALTSEPGDANGDFNVDVLDVISVVSYILGQNPQPFIFAAADVNDDSLINILDVVRTINLILYPGTGMPKTIAYSDVSKSSQQEATLNLVNGKVWLNSPVRVSGIQLRFAGCKDPKALSHLEGLSGLEVSTAEIKGDTAIVLAYSMRGDFIPEGKIALLQSSTKGFSLVSAVLSSSDGKSVSVNVCNNGVPVVPVTYSLLQNYPNPFNPTTTIRYGLPKDVSAVQIVVYDILGRQVRMIEQGSQSKGYHEVIWDSRNSNGARVASGIYFCQFRVRDNNAFRIIGTTKMMLLK
ncbi:MAG TPA: S8 family serine peptidase [Candidatus Kryptonia bacterium]